MAQFRPRQSNENLTDYLKAKQAFEIAQTGKSGVDLGYSNQPRTLTPQDYQMTQDELMGGATGQSAYTTRIATLRGQTPVTGQPGASGGVSEGMTGYNTGNADYDAILNAIEKQIQATLIRGQAINPNVEITPEKSLEFLKQAEGEIEPYYSSQLKLVREDLMRTLGYKTEDILTKESDLERTYGKGLRQLGEQAAETGFLYGGRRRGAEGELAQQTQEQINQQRRDLAFGAETLGSQAAQQWGGTAFTAPNITQAPRVLSGVGTFERPTGVNALYTLNPDIYNSLIGEQQKAQTLGARALQQQYTTAYKEEELAKRQRALNLSQEEQLARL